MEARGVTLRLRTARANPLRRDTDESLALKTRRFRADASSNCSCFRQLRVPWHGVEPLLFDRATVHQARAERAVVHPDQRVARLFQHERQSKGNVPAQPCVVIKRSEAPTTTSLKHAGSFFVCVVDHVSFQQHAFVQDAGNENASRLRSEKHDVLALFHAAQADANVVAGASRRRVVRQPLATGFKLVNVADGLRGPQVRSEYSPTLSTSASA
jgi:hypothetical protein